MLISDFKAQGLRNIRTPPMMTLTKFFHVDVETKIHPLTVLWYSIFNSLWKYLCPNILMMSVLCSAADALQSGNWFTVFKVLRLNAIMLTMFLNLSNFGWSLSSVADYSNTGTRAPTLAESSLYLHEGWFGLDLLFKSKC